MRYSNIFEYGYDEISRDIKLALKDQYNGMIFSDLLEVVYKNLPYVKYKDIGDICNNCDVIDKKFFNATDIDSFVIHSFIELLDNDMKINVSVFDKGKFNIIKIYQYYKELNEIINNNLEINDFDLCNNYFDYYLIMKNSDNLFIKFVDKSMIYAKDFNNTLNNAKKIVTDRIGLENYNSIEEKILENSDVDLKPIITEVISKTKNINEEINRIKKIDINKEINKYQILVDDLLKDYEADLINKEELENYNRLYLGKINKLRIELQELESSKSSSINEDWIKKFKDKKEVDVIDRNIVIEFIDNIYVYEDGNIKIVFKNNDEYL